MSRATAAALTVIRVARGANRPSDDQVRAALQADRKRLAIDEQPLIDDFAITGPYAITLAGRDFDEYVVWER